MSAQSQSWRNEQRSQKYAKWSKISSKITHTPFASKIVECLPPVQGKATIVDLGTGPGLLPIQLGKLLPEARIIGVDPSAEMLEIAQQNAREAGMSHFEAMVGTAEEIPIESDSVDLVVTQSSLHEWEEPQKAFAEVLRVLKPGGVLVLKDYNRAWLSTWKRKLFGFFHHLDMFKFTCEEVADLLREAGFGIIESQGQGLQFLIQASKPIEQP
nr:class I SAM-dependent methyltransferase [Chloroflexota bacterium]